MALVINGITKPTNQDLGFGNGTAIENIYANGILIWALQKYYYISFNNNGGSGSMAQQTIPVGVAMALNHSTFSRTGYLFNGWGNSAAGGLVYTDGQKVTDIAAAGDNKTLYAIWDAIRYTVNYGPNQATGGSTAPTIHTYDVSKQLTQNGFVRPYYTFAGWSWNGTNVVYTDGQWVSNLTTIHNGTVQLYAAWKPIKCIENEDKCTPVSGGISSYSTDAGYKESADFWYSWYGVNPVVTDYCVIQTNSKVDLTNVNYINFIIHGGNDQGTGMLFECGCGIHTTKTNTKSDYDNFTHFGQITAPGQSPGNVNGTVGYTMDVRDITGSYYIKVRAHGNNYNGGNPFYWKSCTFS